MMQPLRRTTAHLHLAYGGGEASQGVIGRRFMLEVEDGQMTLSIDLTPNFHTRQRSAPGYVDAAALARNHQRLSAVQCDDNLVRTRLVRAWQSMREPRLRLVLDLGPRGQFTYAVRPHLMFTGGVQLEVVDVQQAFVPAHDAQEKLA